MSFVWTRTDNICESIVACIECMFMNNNKKMIETTERILIWDPSVCAFISFLCHPFFFFLSVFTQLTHFHNLCFFFCFQKTGKTSLLSIRKWCHRVCAPRPETRDWLLWFLLSACVIIPKKDYRLNDKQSIQIYGWIVIWLLALTIIIIIVCLLNLLAIDSFWMHGDGNQ